MSSVPMAGPTVAAGGPLVDPGTYGPCRSRKRSGAFLLAMLALVWSTRAGAYDHAAWNGLLERHVQPVRDGVATEVDYAGLARERAALEAYLEGLAAVTPEAFRSWPRAERLAFLINAYNAWTVELVLTAWPDLDSIKDLGGLLRTPWQHAFIPLLGETRSLDDIEHRMIRARGAYDEPRIHFVVNCASVGCPALRGEAYRAADLEAQLADATRRFLADRTRNRIAGGRLEVSRIFKWYGEDFDPLGGAQAFLAAEGDDLGLTEGQRRALRDGSLRIGFLPYDWGLNAVR